MTWSIPWDGSSSSCSGSSGSSATVGPALVLQAIDYEGGVQP